MTRLAGRLDLTSVIGPLETPCLFPRQKPDKSTGYVRIYLDGVRLTVHRATWETAHGPIPDGLFVLHRCDVRQCCNVDHLFLGTQKDNIQDCMKKGRKVVRRGEQHALSVLTAADVVEIRRCATAGESQGSLGRRFGVRQQTISKIVRRVLWSSLGEVQA